MGMDLIDYAPLSNQQTWIEKIEKRASKLPIRELYLPSLLSNKDMTLKKQPTK